jgi:Family of unknown function (DUF6221)
VSASANSSAIPELIGFVLARFDEEDAEIARLAAAGSDPAERARRAGETRARREVVTSVQQLLELRDQPNEKAVRDLAVSILRSVATPYADHPGFRAEWHAATR